MSVTVNRYQLGDLVACRGTFTDEAGDVYDPENVFFRFRDPEGAVVEYEYEEDDELERISEGVYQVNIDANKHGEGWFYKMFATGEGQAAFKGGFTVEPDDF